jgi:hypothetical protein
MRTPREFSAVTRAYRLDRAPAVLYVLLAGFVFGQAALHSPSLKFDAAVLLAATAFVVPVSWRGRWSLGFLLRSAVGAYFFRCVLFFLLGTDAIRAIAFVDAMMGIAAMAIAWLVNRWITHYTSHANDADSQPRSQTARTSDEAMQRQEVDTSKTPSRAEDAVRTPPQFNLRTLLLLNIPLAGLVVAGTMAGIGVAFAIAILGLVWIMLGRCVQLISMGGRADDEPNSEPTDD